MAWTLNMLKRHDQSGYLDDAEAARCDRQAHKCLHEGPGGVYMVASEPNRNKRTGDPEDRLYWLYGWDMTTARLQVLGWCYTADHAHERAEWLASTVLCPWCRGDGTWLEKLEPLELPAVVACAVCEGNRRVAPALAASVAAKQVPQAVAA